MERIRFYWTRRPAFAGDHPAAQVRQPGRCLERPQAQSGARPEGSPRSAIRGRFARRWQNMAEERRNRGKPGGLPLLHGYVRAQGRDPSYEG